jgi:hypothetical protein
LAKTSLTVTCGTFSAIAPMACAAATLVSQLLLRKNCLTYSQQTRLY